MKKGEKIKKKLRENMKKKNKTKQGKARQDNIISVQI